MSDEKRDGAAIIYDITHRVSGALFSRIEIFKDGWDACATEMDKERDQWREQAEILADALKLYRNDGIVAREVYAEFEQWKAGVK